MAADEGGGTSSGRAIAPLDAELLGHVQIKLVARLGEGSMTARQMMELKKSDVVTLATSLADFVELYLGDTLVARGEIVAVGDNFGVRITELAEA